MKVTLAQAGIVAGILTLSWVVGGPKEAYSAPSTGEYPHNVFNTTSKAHAEKVASLVPDSIVRVDSGHEETYDPKTSSFSGKLWLVMSKTPDAEARSYFTPWLKENDYFRTNQFLSEVKYEAETDKAADWAVDKEYLIGGGKSILTHDDVCPSCKEGRMEAGNDSYGVQYLGCSKCGYGDSTPMSDLNCSRNWKTSSLEHDWVPYSYECKACGLIAPYIQNVMNSAETFMPPVHKDECTVCVGFADLKDLGPDYEVFLLCEDCITKAKTMPRHYSAEENGLGTRPLETNSWRDDCPACGEPSLMVIGRIQCENCNHVVHPHQWSISPMYRNAESFSAESHQHFTFKQLSDKGQKRAIKDYLEGWADGKGIDLDDDDMLTEQDAYSALMYDYADTEYDVYSEDGAMIISQAAEDEDTTTCEDCEVKIGYDEAISYEGLDRCEDCYDYWMMKDRQNYTGDETDCISCGYSISPNDVRFELVEGLCPDCKADGSFESESAEAPKSISEWQDIENVVVEPLGYPYISGEVLIINFNDEDYVVLGQQDIQEIIDEGWELDTVRWFKDSGGSILFTRGAIEEDDFSAEENEMCPSCERAKISQDPDRYLVCPLCDWRSDEPLPCRHLNIEITDTDYDGEFEGGIMVYARCEDCYADGQAFGVWEFEDYNAESFSAEGIREMEYTAKGDYKKLKGVSAEGYYFTIVNSGRDSPYAILHDNRSWNKNKNDRKLPLNRESHDMWLARCESSGSWTRFPDNWCMDCASNLDSCNCDEDYAESFNADDDYTDEQLLKVARWDIENQIDRGAMYAIDEEPKAEHCDEDGNWEDGENFYTIVNLYAQYQEDEERAEKILWEMFKKEYPQYLGDGMAAESFSADSRWIGSHCRDCGEAKPFNEIEIMAGNARCKPGKGCKQFTKEQMEETQRQMRNEYPDLEWGAESFADRVPFPSSIPSAGTGSSGQMCEVCNESDDLPYDADYFKNCRRCGKAVCHECWDTHIESDDDYHEVCMDCWTVLDNVARYDAEGDVTEDLAEVRTDLSQKRTNMSALRTALSVAGLFLVWDSWRWSKEERKLKGL